MATNYNDYLLQQIRRKLWSIGTISPQLIQGSVLGLVGTGCEEELMYLLREAIIGNNQFAFLFSYIQLIDRLLYFPVFNHMLHNYLIQFYTDVFSHLCRHGHREQLGKMKVIRKYWLGRINPMLYYHLGESVAYNSQEDADNLPKQALLGVKSYFSEVLLMPEPEIMHHLPTFYDQKTIFQQNKIPNNRIVYKVRKNEFKQLKTQGQIQERDHLKIIKPMHLINENIVQIEKEKRIRYPSIETNLSNDSEGPRYLDQDIIVLDKLSQDSSKKDTQNDQHFIKVKSLLVQFRLLFQHQCKECGLKFITKDNHDCHVEKHMQQRLESYKTAKRQCKNNHKFNRRLLNEKQWLSNVDNDQDEEESIVQMQHNETGPIVCFFCKELMEIQFIRQTWLIKKAVNILTDGKSITSHKQCMLTFLDNQQTQ